MFDLRVIFPYPAGFPEAVARGALFLGINPPQDSPQALLELNNDKMSIDDFDSLVLEFLRSCERYFNAAGLPSSIIEVPNEDDLFRCRVDPHETSRLRIAPLDNRPVLQIALGELDSLESTPPNRFCFYLDPFREILFGDASIVENESSLPMTPFVYLISFAQIKHSKPELQAPKQPRERELSISDLRLNNFPSIKIEHLHSPTTRLRTSVSVSTQVSYPEESKNYEMARSMLFSLKQWQGKCPVFCEEESLTLFAYNPHEGKLLKITIPYNEQIDGEASSFLINIISNLHNQILDKESAHLVLGSFEVYDLRNANKLSNDDLLNTKALQSMEDTLTCSLSDFEKHPEDVSTVLRLTSIIQKLSELEIGFFDPSDRDFAQYFSNKLLTFFNKAVDLSPGFTSMLIDFCCYHISFESALKLADAASALFPQCTDFELRKFYLRFVSDESVKTADSIIKELTKADRNAEFETHPAYFRILSLVYEKTGDTLAASTAKREYLRLVTARLYFYESEKDSWWNIHLENEIKGR